MWLTPNTFENPWASLLSQEEIARSTAKPVERPMHAVAMQAQQAPVQPSFAHSAVAAGGAPHHHPDRALPFTSPAADMPAAAAPIASVPQLTNSINSKRTHAAASAAAPSVDFDEDAPPPSDDEEDEADAQFEAFKQAFAPLAHVDAANNAPATATATAPTTQPSIPSRTFVLPPPKSSASEVMPSSSAAAEPSPFKRSFMNLPPPKHS